MFSLVDTIILLEAEHGFLKKLPELSQIREEARDIFLWLAQVLGYLMAKEGLGDEYGIAEPLVRRALANISNLQQLRKLVRYRELVELPRYIVTYGILTPLIGVSIAGMYKEGHLAGILRVIEASKTLDLPFTFIADLRQVITRPVPINPQRYLAWTQVPKLPGPRLYYNIEKCLKCTEEGDGKVHCVAYVEDGTCMDPDSLHSLHTMEGTSIPAPQTEVIFVEKWVEQRENYVSRRIIVAFSYSLSNLLSDENLYRAYGWL